MWCDVWVGGGLEWSGAVQCLMKTRTQPEEWLGTISRQKHFFIFFCPKTLNILGFSEALVIVFVVVELVTHNSND